MFREDVAPRPLVRRLPSDAPGKVDHLSGAACTTRTDVPVEYNQTSPPTLQRTLPTRYMRDRLLAKDRKEWMNQSTVWAPGQGYGPPPGHPQHGQ